MKIKNCPDNLFNENMIFNIKEFASNLLEIKKLSFKGVLVLVFITLNTCLQKILTV